MFSIYLWYKMRRPKRFSDLFRSFCECIMRNILERLVPFGNKSHEWPQILAIFIACLSGFTMGLHFNWTSPSITILTSNASHIEPMSLEEASYFTVIPPIAAIITGPIFALVVDIFGRKKTIMFIAVPQIISFLMIAMGENTITFYIAKFMTGVGDAAFFTALPMYVGEVSTPKVRGSWGNLLTISIYFGGFAMNIIGSSYGIRASAYICVCAPLLQILFIGFLPESPYFLLMKGREEEARTSLRKLRWQENVEEELMSLTKAVQRQISESGTFKDLFTIPANRKALLVSAGIRATQQFSGISAFAVYTQYLFNQAGSDISASTSAIIYSGMIALLNTISSFFADRFGRRPLMMFSSFGCGIVIALEAVYFYIYQKTDIDVSAFSWFPLGGMLMYIVACAAGLGILPTLMLGELFSASIKGKALYAINILFCLFVLTSSKLFQIMSSNFGMYAPFCLFAASCFLGVIFSYYFVPETKGKTLEEIQQNLRGCKAEEEVTSKKNSLCKV